MMAKNNHLFLLTLLFFFFIGLCPVSFGSDLNVMLITIDTLRTDRVSAYSSQHVQTPNMDRLGEKGAVFTKAFAHNPTTLPSHANMLTGLTPLYHGVRENTNFVVRPEMLTLAEHLKEKGIKVSIFIDPDLNQVKAAHKIGVDYIEIHTGIYAKAKSVNKEDEEFDKIVNAAKLAGKLGLGVNAGHDLTYRNVSRIANIKEIEELNIGHNIIARAVLVGMDRAVKEMLALIGNTQ